MWLLTCEHETDSALRGRTFALLLNKDMYDVGREKSDILLTETSVSRKHAKLYPVSDCVKLEDEKSLFGTFLNNSKKRIPKDEHTFLRDGDRVSFGTLQNAWRLSKVDISVITTKLDPRESLELKSVLRILNGNFISSDWSNSVTHLVTSTNIAFTPKFLLALVNCVPVVTWTYFKDAVDLVTQTGSLPAVEDYTPTLSNFPVECDFRVNESRKNLFDGLIFIFLEERLMSVYERLVKSAGGTATLWDKKKPSIIRVASRVIVDSKRQAEQSELNEYLLTKGRRLIPDGEIGLAIAMVSTSQYCNAKFHPQMGHILALETPCVQDCNSSDLILIEEVPETIVIDDDNVVDKTALRPGVNDRTILSNTEIPETVVSTGQSSVSVANVSAAAIPQFPDDDEDGFNARSQRILEIVDQYSSPAVPQRKRKHSAEEEESEEMESQQTKKSSIANESQTSNESQLSRFNSSHFIARPSQKRMASQLSEATPSIIPPAPVASKTKRTLADLLAKDDDDSEDDDLIFKKKTKVAPSKPIPPKGLTKVLPSLLPAPSIAGNSGQATIVGDAVDGRRENTVEKIQISQLTGWLTKKPSQEDCSIKMESLNLDETHAWIGPLMNAIQVREIKVDLSNYSTSRTTTMTNSTISNASMKRNFKTFKKQSFRKCGADYSELAKTKSVLITEKL